MTVRELVRPPGRAVSVRRGVRLAGGVGPGDAHLVARVVADEDLLDLGARGRPTCRRARSPRRPGRGPPWPPGCPTGCPRAPRPGVADCWLAISRPRNAVAPMCTVDGRLARLDLLGDGQRGVDRDRVALRRGPVRRAGRSRGPGARGPEAAAEAAAEAAVPGPAELVVRRGRGVDADDLAVRVHQRAARVAGLDVRVGLDQPGELLGGAGGLVGGGDRLVERGDRARPRPRGCRPRRPRCRAPPRCRRR